MTLLRAIVGALVLLLVAASVALAGSGGRPGGGSTDRIYFVRANDGQQLEIAPDGTGLKAVGCVGDRTHAGAPRRVLRAEPGVGSFVAYTSLYTGPGFTTLPIERIVSRDEACADPQALAELPSGYDVGLVAWSIDDHRVAATIDRYDSRGQLIDTGIWVGELDASCPTGLCGFHLAVALPLLPVGDPDPESGLVAYARVAPGGLSWSSDGRRVTWWDYCEHPNGPWAIYVADLGLPGSTTEGTAARVPISPIIVRGTAQYPRMPAFSPVPGDDRIAVAMTTAAKSCWRGDIFVVHPDGSGLARITTTSTNGTCELGSPAWSPDGRTLAFDGWSGALSAGHAIFKVPADGSGRAVQVTPSSPYQYRVPAWRR